MPLLPLFYLHHRADGTAVLMSREAPPETGRAAQAKDAGRPAASASA